jgi:predicted metal-dependent peptidase
MLTTNDKLAAARMTACKRFPYFRVGIMRLVFQPAPGLGTLGVSPGWVVLYDPAVVDAWTVGALATVLVHELMHLLRRHTTRQEASKIDPAAYNICADAEVNDDLVEAGLEMPAGSDPVVPGKLGQPTGLSAEEYYRGMVKNAQKRPQAGKPGQGGGGGQGQGQGSEGENAPQGQKQGPVNGEKVLEGRCGGGAGGEPLPGEAEADAHMGRKPAEHRRIERMVAEAVRREASKGRGTVPGDIARWADQVLDPPRIPWQQRLARAVRQAVAYRPGAVDYRFSRLSRRQSGIGYGAGRPIIPALVAPFPRVAVVVDTSGSMGAGELVEAIAEIRGILQAVGGAVDLLACDADVHAAGTARSWHDVTRMLKGGGGTDMKPALKALAARRVRPDVVVIMTDGYIGDPGERPPFRVVWCLCGKSPSSPDCSWGEIVKIDTDMQEEVS